MTDNILNNNTNVEENNLNQGSTINEDNYEEFTKFAKGIKQFI